MFALDSGTLSDTAPTIKLALLSCTLQVTAWMLHARDQVSRCAGETEAAKEFGRGLLIGPFNVGWLGVERFKKLK